MRYESSVTSLSWIPSEAVEGGTRLAFDAGFTHYDDPPPDQLDDLEALRDADRFRFANVLRAWIEVDPAGRITGSGYAGGGLMGATTVRVGGIHRRFQAVALPELCRDPEHGAGWVRFTQTTGGRTGLPAPRRVSRPPFVQWQAPLVWTTLSLTLHADGRAESAVTGASPFPRHWIYDHQGRLSGKSGLTDFRDWYRSAFGRHSPWGDADSPALVTAVETALERALSVRLMHGGHKPRLSRLQAGRRAGPPGRARHGRVPGPGRSDPGRAGRPGAGGVRPRRDAGRAGPPGGRRQDLVAGRCHRHAGWPRWTPPTWTDSALEELATGHRREDSGQV